MEANMSFQLDLEPKPEMPVACSTDFKPQLLDTTKLPKPKPSKTPKSHRVKKEKWIKSEEISMESSVGKIKPFQAKHSAGEHELLPMSNGETKQKSIKKVSPVNEKKNNKSSTTEEKLIKNGNRPKGSSVSEKKINTSDQIKEKLIKNGKPKKVSSLFEKKIIREKTLSMLGNPDEISSDGEQKAMEAKDSAAAVKTLPLLIKKGKLKEAFISISKPKNAVSIPENKITKEKSKQNKQNPSKDRKLNKVSFKISSEKKIIKKKNIDRLIKDGKPKKLATGNKMIVKKNKDKLTKDGKLEKVSSNLASEKQIIMEKSKDKLTEDGKPKMISSKPPTVNKIIVQNTGGKRNKDGKPKKTSSKHSSEKKIIVGNTGDKWTKHGKLKKASSKLFSEKKIIVENNTKDKRTKDGKPKKASSQLSSEKKIIEGKAKEKPIKVGKPKKVSSKVAMEKKKNKDKLTKDGKLKKVSSKLAKEKKINNAKSQDKLAQNGKPAMMKNNLLKAKKSSGVKWFMEVDSPVRQSDENGKVADSIMELSHFEEGVVGSNMQSSPANVAGLMEEGVDSDIPGAVEEVGDDDIPGAVEGAVGWEDVDSADEDDAAAETTFMESDDEDCNLKMSKKCPTSDNIIPLKCEICLMSFRSRPLLLHHIIQADNKPDICSICYQPMQHNQDMRQHMVQHGENNTRGECEECRGSHLAHHHRRPPEDGSGRRKRRNLCRYSSGRLLLRNPRVCRDPDESRHCCDSCSQRFISDLQLTHHLKEVHKSEVFVCHACNKRFGSQDNFKQHLDTKKHARNSQMFEKYVSSINKPTETNDQSLD